MVHACYTYIGKKPLWGIKRDKEYQLLIYKQNIVERLFGTYPFSWNIVVTRPYEPHTPVMHYDNWKDFHKDWKKVCQTS